MDRHKHASKQTHGTRNTTRTALDYPITWRLAFFLLGYMGAGVSLEGRGGWITTFNEPFSSFLLRL